MIVQTFNDLMGTTSFGTGFRITMPGNITPVEIIKFYTEGSDHKHDLWEHAILLGGDCEILINNVAFQVIEGETFLIAPDTLHRMCPRTTSYWLIWYTKE